MEKSAIYEFVGYLGRIMTSRLSKPFLAFFLGWTSGLIACLVNHLPLGDAMLRSLGFGILVTAIVSILAWASETVEKKGYPSWLGFWLVVILNIFGILIIWLLPGPDNKLQHRKPSDINITD